MFERSSSNQIVLEYIGKVIKLVAITWQNPTKMCVNYNLTNTLPTTSSVKC
jgi:hypothetical protein